MEEILKHVINAVEKAGEVVLSYYGKNVEARDKDDNSPVTIADQESNQLLARELGRYGFGWLSEESADNGSRLDKEYAWIVDPLDGTRDFLQETGEFTIMVGLAARTEKLGSSGAS